MSRTEGILPFYLLSNFSPPGIKSNVLQTIQNCTHTHCTVCRVSIFTCEHFTVNSNYENIIYSHSVPLWEIIAAVSFFFARLSLHQYTCKYMLHSYMPNCVLCQWASSSSQEEHFQRKSMSTSSWLWKHAGKGMWGVKKNQKTTSFWVSVCFSNGQH